LESTTTSIQNANRKLSVLERELVAKGEEITLIEGKIAEFCDIFQNEKSIFDEKLREMVMKMHTQKQHLKKQRALLNSISSERQDTVREIETLNVKMGSKEASHHSELDKISAASLQC
jgi:ketopantoate reductase